MNKEKPILFNDDMVRAILSGEKTQSRRVAAGVMPDNCLWLKKPTKTKSGVVTHVMDAPKHGLSPYGNIGDRLWVRETWWQAGYSRPTYPGDDEYSWHGSRRVHYAADGNPPNEPNRDYPKGLYNGAFSAAEPNRAWKKRPSIHMPRWASRTTLEVTAVRVERLNDITEADCWAEGVLEIDGQFSNQEIVDMAVRLHLSIFNARVQYALLWESIYGAGSWDKNPWVWVIEFKRME